jgi:DNA-binding transcriptional LysR family regulator
MRAFRSIVAVADHGSFAAAAEAVHLSQSALSTQMKQLEDRLGRELFDRAHRPPILNPYGQAIVERARQILFLYKQMFELVAGDGGLSGVMKVGVIPTWVTGVLPTALSILRREQPGFSVHVVQALSEELCSKLERGEVEAAIIPEPSNRREDMAWHYLAEEPFMLIAPKHTAASDWAGLLKSEPYIRYTRHAWAGQRIETALLEQGVHVNAVMELDTLEAVTVMVEAGLGVSIAPRRTGAPSDGGVRWIPFGAAPLSRRIGLLQCLPNSRGRMIATLIDALRMSLHHPLLVGQDGEISLGVHS